MFEKNEAVQKEVFGHVEQQEEIAGVCRYRMYVHIVNCNIHRSHNYYYVIAERMGMGVVHTEIIYRYLGIWCILSAIQNACVNILLTMLLLFFTFEAVHPSATSVCAM